MTEGNRGTDDERWHEFVREFEKSRGIHEPSAAEREAGAEVATKRPRRRGLMVATAVAGAVAVVAGVGFWLSAGHGTRHETADKAAGHAPASSSRRPAKATEPERSAEPSTAPASMLTLDEAFPAHVGGYTKVYQTGGRRCTGAIGPNLTALIKESKGCQGVIGALYKDASDNQYTIVAFGMKDQADVIRLTTILTMNDTDYEVPVLVPPAGSGLKTLPADSAVSQAFAADDNLLVVGMAQWSDGHAGDFGGLNDRLRPLMEKVRKEDEAHHRG
ncbi:hypothetical protein [Streptomyces sp. NRAIS3]